MVKMHAAGTPKHILVINNDPGIIELFRELLEEEGYRVSTRTYLDHDLHAITDLAPDLIVLDYMWAGDDNSWAMLQLLRMDRDTKAIPIVLCSAAKSEMLDLSAHLEEMGVVVVLKPFDIDRLLLAIERALGSDGGQSERGG